MIHRISKNLIAELDWSGSATNQVVSPAFSADGPVLVTFSLGGPWVSPAAPQIHLTPNGGTPVCTAFRRTYYSTGTTASGKTGSIINVINGETDIDDISGTVLCTPSPRGLWLFDFTAIQYDTSTSTLRRSFRGEGAAELTLSSIGFYASTSGAGYVANNSITSAKVQVFGI